MKVPNRAQSDYRANGDGAERPSSCGRLMVGVNRTVIGVNFCLCLNCERANLPDIYPFATVDRSSGTRCCGRV